MPRWLLLTCTPCLLAACATSDTDPIRHPTGPDELVLRWESQPGYVRPMPWEPFQAMPAWSLYGDGLVLMPRLRPDGSAWPEIRAVRLAEQQVPGILRAARGAFRTEPGVDFDFPGVTDAGTDIITLAADGRHHRVTAYALDVEVDPRLGRASGVDRDGRRRLRDLGERIWHTSAAPDAVPATFEPQALAVVVLPYAVLGGWPDPAGRAPPPVPWPLIVPLTGAPRCFVLRGAEIAAVRSSAAQATMRTPWTSEGAEYLVVLRPVLPDERAISRVAHLPCDSTLAAPAQ